MFSTPSGDPGATSPTPSATPAEVRVYISDMLCELADMAGGMGDRRLERWMRLLAVDAAAHDPACE